MIYPVPEGESRVDANIEQSIALASWMGRIIMDWLVQKKLVEFLEENDLLVDIQHGFQPGKSYLTQSYLDGVWELKQLLKNSNMVMLYLDS